MKKCILSLLLISFSLLGFSQNYQGDKDEINSILKKITDFSSYVMKSEHKNIANSYTVDAKIFPNNRDILEGRDTIQDYWTFAEGVSITHHNITPVEIVITGDEAYDYGYYEGTTQMADGSSSSWKGKYVIIWKKVGNEWKIYLDIWNNISD